MTTEETILALGDAVEWPSLIRGPMMVDAAVAVGVGLDLERGVGYLGVALLSEIELSNGDGGRRLYNLCETILAELLESAEHALAALERVA